MKEQPFTQAYSFDAIDDRDFRSPKTNAAQPAAATLIPAGERPKNVILIVLESTGVEYFGAHRLEVSDNSAHRQAGGRARHRVRQYLFASGVELQEPDSVSASVYDRPDWLLTVRDHPQFDIPTIAQVLKGAGYRTCYAHSGYWEWQGRDKFLKARGVDKLIGAGGRPQNLVNSWGINDDKMYQEMLDWIDERPNEPFFAFAYTIETHHPYVRRPRASTTTSASTTRNSTAT